MISKIIILKNCSISVQNARCLIKFFKPDTANSTSEKYREKGTQWLERCVNSSPDLIHPYLKLMRFDRPIGTWLLYLPCTWGIALASPLGEWPSLWTLGLFGAGAVLMRGAGCTVNDLWDRDFDKHVDRTRSRPITSGKVSVIQAMGFVGVQCLTALGVLLQFNNYTIALGMASTLLVVTYPLFKRVTYWPQVVLGFAFNYGAMLGYSAVTGVCYWPVVLPSYLAGLCWTMVYDSVYALQDIEDDQKLGLKSTAIYFGDNCKPWLSLFGVGMATLLGLAGLQSGAGPIFYCGAASAMVHVAHQIYSLRINDRAHCLHTFKVNRNTGLLIFASIALDRALATTALTTATGLMI